MISICRWACIVGVGFAFLGQCSSNAQAGFITSLKVEVTPSDGGMYTYVYTMINDTKSTLPAVEFTLNVDTAAALQQLHGPSGWVISYNPADTAVDWSSFSPLTHIQPGARAAFSFTSPLSPGPQDYSLLGITTNPPAIETNQGQISSPSVASIPEPTSMIPLGIGMASLAGYAGYRWRTSADH